MDKTDSWLGASRRVQELASKRSAAGRRVEPDEIVIQMVRDVLRNAPALLTFAEASKRTGYSSRTLQRWAAGRKLKVVRLAGASPRIPRQEIERLLCDGFWDA